MRLHCRLGKDRSRRHRRHSIASAEYASPLGRHLPLRYADRKANRATLAPIMSAPSAFAILSPFGASFSIATRSVSAAIQSRFIAPPRIARLRNCEHEAQKCPISNCVSDRVDGPMARPPVARRRSVTTTGRGTPAPAMVKMPFQSRLHSRAMVSAPVGIVSDHTCGRAICNRASGRRRTTAQRKRQDG
jgi:hypothetical protein